MRLPFGRPGLLAAAALAGAVVYWRVGAQRRARISEEIDRAVAEGRAAADQALAGSASEPEPEPEPFDSR